MCAQVSYFTIERTTKQSDTVMLHVTAFSFTVLCTADPKGASEDNEVTSAGDECLMSMAAEEMVICITVSFHTAVAVSLLGLKLCGKVASHVSIISH